MENIVGFFGSILIVLTLITFTVMLLCALFGFVVALIDIFNDFKTISNKNNQNKKKNKSS